MIPVANLILDLDLKLNKQASVDHQAIFTEYKIVALRQAQIKLIKKKLNPNNIFQLGFDTMTKRYEDLQTLVVPYTNLPLTSVGDKFNAYRANIADLPSQYFIPVSLYALGTKDCCVDSIIGVINIIKHADLPETLNDTNWTPSFPYQETIATISNNQIFLYSDSENSFKLTSLYISYLRYPAQIDIAGYTHLDGTASTNQDCELPDYLEDELVDLAVQELAMSTENQSAVQYSQLRNKENE
jgi:hypothetical protein